MHRSSFGLRILIVTLGLLASVSAWARGAPGGIMGPSTSPTILEPQTVAAGAGAGNELPAQFPCILEPGSEELSAAAGATRSGCCDDICQLDDPCPSDCTTIILCGDYVCNGGETCSSCPADCGTCPCGDGICNGSETYVTCPLDCSAFPYPFYSFYRGDHLTRIYTGRSYNGTFWTGDEQLGNRSESTHGPAAVLFNGQIYVFYRGNRTSELYVSQSPDGTTWPNDRQLNSGSQTNDAPGAAVFQGRIYVVHKGNTSDAIWITSSANGINWTTNAQILSASNGTRDAPSLTVYDGKLILAHQHGASRRIRLWWTSDGTTWNFRDELTSRSDFGVGLTEFDGKLWVAYSEYQTKDLYVMSWDPTEHWSAPIRVLSARASERPSLATDGNRLVVLYKGATNANIFYAYSFNGTQWFGNAHAIGKTWYGGPALLSTD